MRDDAELAKRLSGPTADAHFKALQVIDGVDFLFEPAAHLRACITHQQALGVELGAEFIDQLLPIALIKPGVLLASVQTERRRAKQSPCRIFADVVILSAVAHLDCAILYGIKCLQRRNDLAAGKNLDLEFAVGRFRNGFGKRFTSAKQSIE